MKRSRFKKQVLSAVLTAILLLNSWNISTVLAATDDPIVFLDAALRQALIDAGADANGNGEITEGELYGLTGTLSLKNLGITDLSGLQYATRISALDISDNRIRSIAPIKGLTLTNLDVSNNYLDIADGSDDMADVGALTTTGCVIVYSPQKDIPVESVSLDKTSLTLCTGDTAALTATVAPADAKNQTVTWASDDESIATVADGTITTVSVGTVKITVTTGDGSHTAECAVTVKSPKIETDAYTIDGCYLTNVSKLTSPGQLKANLKNNSEDLRVYKKDGAELTDGSVGTGMTLKLIVNGAVRDTLSIIVKGDTNGDGMISIIDYTLIRLDILGIKSLWGIYRTAGDTNSDGAISIIDYTLIRLDILSLKAIGGYKPNLPEVTDARIRAFLDVALAQQGKPYVWGAEGPNDFDCSGYIYYCLTQVGYPVYRATANTYSKWRTWQYVDRNALQPGDLMFYRDDDDPTRIGHIGIYLGNGYHIHASSSYDCVIICKIDGWYDETLSYGLRVWY